VNSLDTNILVYALNEEACESQSALCLVNQALEQADQWIIADQTYFELYAVLRNPKIWAKPMSGTEALKRIDFFRNSSGFLRCAYHPDQWESISKALRGKNFPARRLFDVVLAKTLIASGVTHFHTRNVKDFEQLGFRKVINPID
jgi:predicted nucleic acid-binding protein